MRNLARRTHIVGIWHGAAMGLAWGAFFSSAPNGVWLCLGFSIAALGVTLGLMIRTPLPPEEKA